MNVTWGHSVLRLWTHAQCSVDKRKHLGDCRAKTFKDPRAHGREMLSWWPQSQWSQKKGKQQRGWGLESDCSWLWWRLSEETRRKRRAAHTVTQHSDSWGKPGLPNSKTLPQGVPSPPSKDWMEKVMMSLWVRNVQVAGARSTLSRTEQKSYRR